MTRMWMDASRIPRIAFPLLFLVGTGHAFSADQTPPSKDWTFDTIKLKNGYVFKGLILEETQNGVRFQHVRRANGRATVSLTAVLRRGDIERIDKVSDADRELLRKRLAELDPTGEGERKRMEALELKIVGWNGHAKAGRRYDSDHFTLVSDAPEEIVRRAAVRLEQIYTAYAHYLPPRFPGGKATTIMLHPSLDEYQKILDGQGWKFQNPAFFDASSNRIVCGSNLVKLGKDLEAARQQNQDQRAKLDVAEARIRELFGKKPKELAIRMQDITRGRKTIVDADKYNDGVYDNATKRLFAILYHEAFHAYVCNFVYPPVRQPKDAGPPGELPRWLNEGLAQVFETAIVEAGELRVGHADKERLARVKEALRQGEMMPVKELLNSGPNQFIVLHRGDRIGSDRAYLASWALASFLTFDRRLLGSSNLDTFVRAINKNKNAEEAFAKLTGQKIADFEKDFHNWLTKLQPDGSLVESVGGKDR
jgi:hypothetical protein